MSVEIPIKESPCIGCTIVDAVHAAFPEGPPQDVEDQYNFIVRMARTIATVQASLDEGFDMLFIREFSATLESIRSGESGDLARIEEHDGHGVH